MWAARQFVPMLVKTVRGLRNHLDSVAYRQESPYRQERRKKNSYIQMLNGKSHAHTVTFYFAGSLMKDDIRPMQRRET